MVPSSFAEANTVLDKPPAMDNCDALSVLRAVTADGLPCVISCWKLTQDEVCELTRTGRLWVTIYGLTMPPIALTAAKPWE